MPERLLLDPDLAPALHDAGIVRPQDLFELGGTGAETSFGGFVACSVAGTNGRFYLKRYRYAGWRQAKGLLGRGSLWGRAPEINEFLALAWLRAHGLPAVRPVAAAARTARGRLVAHALLTEAVPGAESLATRLEAPGDPLRESPRLRRRLCTLLGESLGRMHAAHFAHRDCHARNLLVAVDGDDVRLWWADCRRGGTGGWRRRALFDLACLDRDLRGVLSRTERRRALRAYLGRGRNAGELVRRIALRRERLPPPRRPRR